MAKAESSPILQLIRRAGADMILTYHARDVAKWMA